MDIPDDIPFNMAIGVILARSDLIGDRTMDEKLKPFQEQYDLGPGDAAIISSAESLIDKDFTAVQILGPEQYAEEFPDWEDRLHNSYVLCKWNSEHDPEGETGWFARVKLIHIEESHYLEVQQWVEKEDFPSQPPAWLKEYYDEYTDKLSKVTPGAVPVTPTCPECGSREIQLHAIQINRMAGQAGEIEREGQSKYVVRHQPQADAVREAHLHCMDCNARGDLSDEEWDFEFR